ncbi:MAG: DNA-directed RNA polymerase subunit L [Methanomicrobiales archaeon]|jgi:DNA-directed RNA polymerase subunit L|nr:DNA-directed RNA polymerase subunit L [Methanomicrobiales archaeon]
MNLKVLALAEEKVHLVIVGEGHTFMNALTEELLKDPGVDIAKYVIKFQFSDPELLVTTKGGKSPLLAITEACMRMMATCEHLLVQARAV